MVRCLRGWGAVIVIVVVTVVLWTALLSVVARAKFGGDPRGMLFLGTSFYHPPAFDGIPRCGRYGYDGQFYAALAIDPFLRSPETLKALDAPGLRASRILLPMAAWLAGLGRPAAEIVAYQWLCWALGVGAVVLAAIWLRTEGSSPLPAALLAVNAGLVTAMFRSTLDGATTCLVVAALLLHGRGRHGAGVAAASLATLARETGFLAGIACAIQELAGRRPRRAVGYLLVPAALRLAWQLYLQVVWRPNFRFTSAISWPLVGLVHRFRAVLGGARLLQSQEFWAAAGAALTIAAGVAVLGRPRRWEAPRMALIAFAALAAFLSTSQYVEAYNYARIVMAGSAVSVVVAAAERNGWMKAVLLGGPVAFACSGILMIGRELGLF